MRGQRHKRPPLTAASAVTRNDVHGRGHGPIRHSLFKTASIPLLLRLDCKQGSNMCVTTATLAGGARSAGEQRKNSTSTAARRDATACYFFGFPLIADYV